jgi:hypothetical protein
MRCHDVLKFNFSRNNSSYELFVTSSTKFKWNYIISFKSFIMTLSNKV